MPPLAIARVAERLAALPLVSWLRVGKVQLVSVPLAGVPRAGVVSIGLVRVLLVSVSIQAKVA